jgi:hypothetical protein
MSDLSLVEMMCAYASATGLPPTGAHRKLTDQVVMRLGVPCESCDGTGLQLSEGKRHFCSDCHGFLRRLSAADVIRLYQIVTARFPELLSRITNVQAAADRWHLGKPVPATVPRHLGLETLPAAVPLRPDATALPVASVTWRGGGRSNYLWTASTHDDVCVLWERLPALLLADGEPWAEVFSWERGGAADPARSAKRLLRCGWAESNPAYDWLAAPRMSTFFGLSKFFSVDFGWLVSERELGSMFLAAVQARDQTAGRPSPNLPSKLSVIEKPLNIGPYNFGARLSTPKEPAPQASDPASVAGTAPTNDRVDAGVLVLNRTKRPILH